MKYLSVLAAAALLLAINTNPAVVAQDDKLPEVADTLLLQPALSPDGATLAFVHDGDIWSVPAQGGTARRLTITEDNDGDPQFSPDGKWLAFRSRRYGNDDVFVMPAEGGPARRLTFADAGDSPDCWLPDSSGVIFSSYRRGGRDLWVVRLEGGEPWPISGGGYGSHEYHAAISPDGKHIAYSNSGGSPMRRRGYQGQADSDIWLCDFDGLRTSNHRRITQNTSHDASPAWRSNEVLAFVTCAGGNGGSARVGRLALYDLRTKEVIEPGEQRAIDPREIAIGGRFMAISSGNYGGWKLYLWDLLASLPFRLLTPEIKLSSDVRRAELQSTTLTSAEEYAVSPDGKKIAFIAGGDVYVMPAKEDAVPLRLTDTLIEDKGLAWSPDSTQLVTSTSLQGRLMIMNLAGLGTDEGVTTLRKMPGRSVEGYRKGWSHPVVSKNGVVYAYGDEREIVEIHRFGDSDAAKAKPIKGTFHGVNIGSPSRASFDVSADGRWILYEQPNANYDDVVMLADTASGETHVISHLFGSVSQPRFSADGKRVLFVNDQEGSYDMWSIELAPEGPKFREDEVGEAFKKKEEKKKEEGKEGDSGKKAPPELKVVLKDIKERCKRITSLDGNESDPVALSDGRTYVFIGSSQGQSNLWKLELDQDKGPDLKQLTQSRTGKSALKLSADEKTLWWLDAGKITSMPVAGGKTTTYGFNIEQRRNRAELRQAAFDEAAWVMGEYFYDRKHHGIDWAGTTARYKQAINAASTGDEYDMLMDELLGELNSSHQGFTGADRRSDDFSESTGCLGLLFDPLELVEGKYRITEVLKDGPCDLPEGKPEIGEYLVGVNGQALFKGGNLAALLVSTTGKKTTLNLAKKPEYEGSRALAVKPVSSRSEYGLYYQRWVRQQRDMVDGLSGGRLGYVHIAAMDGPSLAAFKHELGDEMLGKEGVVIDVRYNGGGYTAVDILEILMKKPWLKRQWGGLEQVSENIYRSIALEKPSILMINQASFSNAEILAEGYRRLGVGKIVGVDTAGGVIGTGSYTLIDGSRMRLPSTGAYTVEGENLELAGRKPDIFVENTPEELDQGKDRQTETAVKELLKQIDK
ncbi:MAG: PD40 domain-containing protein [Planctomycetes bacterium]|nr:PD40 domain-containing protein [Planctomycetota bacterium]MCB9934692.1 PD40 domain-containing protein [Planctomycetota bacterium]